MKKYKIIYADPAWSYEDKCLHRGGAERHYKTMNIEDIKKLPIDSISDKDSILFIWVVFPKLQDGLDVIKAWGFNYKTIGFVWIKTNKRTKPEQLSFLPSDSFDSFMGMGNWTRSNAELCLIAVKGKPKRVSANIHSVVYSPIDKHSKKPKEIRDKIVKLMGDVPRVELFARQKIEGWHSWGNEVENNINI